MDDEGVKEVAYCFNAKALWPDLQEETMEDLFQKGYLYSKLENASDEQMHSNADEPSQAANLAYYIRRTIYHGYPYNYSGIKQKFQLNNMQFRAVTQAVVWLYTDSKDMDSASFSLCYNSDFHEIFKWTDNMTKAYNELISEDLSAPPDNFQLDLFIAQCQEDGANFGTPVIQNLLSAKKADVPEEIPEPTKIDISLEKH